MAACSEAASAERLIICRHERVGEGPRGSGGACPSPGGVAGWMISLTKGIFCNPFPAVPGHRLTEGHRDSPGEPAGGCGEVAECLCSACVVTGCRARGRARLRWSASCDTSFWGSFFSLCGWFRENYVVRDARLDISLPQSILRHQKIPFLLPLLLISTLEGGSCGNFVITLGQKSLF